MLLYAACSKPVEDMMEFIIDCRTRGLGCALMAAFEWSSYERYRQCWPLFAPSFFHDGLEFQRGIYHMIDLRVLGRDCVHFPLFTGML